MSSQIIKVGIQLTMLADLFAVDTALSLSSTLASGIVNSCSFVPATDVRHPSELNKKDTSSYDSRIRSSILITLSSSLSVTKLTATPIRPRRAVRPTRCVYSSGSVGTSQFTTSATSSMSRPRAPTSVVTSTGTTQARKRLRALSLARWVRRECSAVARMLSVCRRRARYAAVRVRAQKMIVGGGCSNESGSSSDEDLRLLPWRF